MIEDHVRAVARFRPVDQPESSRSPWIFDGTTGRIKAAHSTHVFNYDCVLPSHTTNREVHEQLLPQLHRFISGTNMSVLCYGQTNSGKTYTMFGSTVDEGVVPRSVRWVFSQLELQQQSTIAHYRVAVSFLEVYNEVARDLLNPSGTDGLTIREKDGVTFAEDATVCVCDDAETALKWIEYGNANKTIGSSYLHDRSSRAHTIFLLSLAVQGHRAGRRTMCTVSRSMFVDLAGSEALSHELGAAQQTETKAINLSLFALRNTIKALAGKEKFVPVRESVLTRLLSPCLINAVSVMIVTCSNENDNLGMTASTLRFGELSKQVVQVAVPNEVCLGKQCYTHKATRREKNVRPIVVKLADAVLPLQTADEGLCEIVQRSFRTRQGIVQGTYVDKASNNSKPALFLHAYGNDCCGDDFIPVMRFLACECGYTCYSFDFPGFGRTGGTRQASRSERLSDSGGSMEIVHDVLMDICAGGSQALVIGWDWGGNMALTLALSPFRNRILGLCLYHPSYTLPISTLQGITLPVLLLWIPSDQLHLYSSGKKMAAVMKKSSLVSMVLKPGEAKSHDHIWAVMCSAIGAWLPQSVRAEKAPSHIIVDRDLASESDATGDDDDDERASSHSSMLATLLCDPVVAATVAAQKNANFPPKLVSASPVLQDFAAPSFVKSGDSSVSILEQFVRRDEIFHVQCALLNRSAQKHERSRVLGLLGNLPTLLPHHSLADFQAVGFFLSCQNTDGLALRQYRAGRCVFVRLPGVDSNMKDSERFMKIAPNSTNRPVFGTYRATIARSADASSSFADVLVPLTDGSRLVTVGVPWVEVEAWNQPTKFATPRHRVLMFEDAITCNYENIVMRCKLAEIALALTPLVEQIANCLSKAEELSVAGELSHAGLDLLALQRRAVAVVRSKMNMIHHVQMGKDPGRYCVPDCGKLATFGQWHCHGMASVFASLLIPFSNVLHMDVRYRDGFFVKDGRDVGGVWDGIPRALADHTWLEVTFFPSAVSFVADPSFDHAEGVTVPVLEAYSLSGRRFPMRGIANGGVEPFVGPRSVV